MMKKLILMRHAKSSWEYPDLDDHARPLNRRGQKSAKALGDWLRTNGHLPDQILCSTSERTRQTLAGLALPAGIQTRFLGALYHADPAQLTFCLKQATGHCVLVIAHNPGIADWAQDLATPAPDHPRFQDFPTGATLVLDVVPDQPGRMRPVDFIIPRELS